MDIDKFTESDVEMKRIYPLLIKERPEGLGLKEYNIQTKASLKKILIDKGTSQKLYYPDLAITISGVPSIIIEAKKPNEDLDEAYRQACLYASELNREFPSKINPCELVIASDGKFLYAGHIDTNKPDYKIPYSDWNNTNVLFDQFLKEFNTEKLESNAKTIKNKLRTEAKFKNPINLLGGKKIRNLESSNTFGENISIQYRHLFNPNIENEKKEIVENAYVKLNKVESHINPIDKILRKKVFNDDGTLISDFNNPVEITSKFKNHSALNNQVILLIGSVGSGKSTFTTYLKEVALEDEIKEKTYWINLNLNDAPLNKEEIYNWTKNSILNNIKEGNKKINFNSLDFIQELYKEEISDIKNGPLALLDENSEKYKELLVERILKLQDNQDLTLKKTILNLINSKSKSLVIVLDNCDKRNTEEQLLMFEVANWIKDNIQAIVFLPIRDTTFENYKHDKPLDTVVKDLIFKINPPSLEQVLSARISYISQLSNSNNDGFYFLDNGMKVKYPSKEEENYLNSILSSLFSNDFFKNLISGFTGRNIRNGIEIFLDFCKSGHINDSEITKILKSKGKYILPNHLISKVFIRGSKVYYTDSNSRIKNIFLSIPDDTLPDPFVRISILKYLKERIKKEDDVKGLLGYVNTTKIVQFLSSIGHDEKRVINEFKTLLKLNIIENESLNPDIFNINDLVKITSIGFAHYHIMKNIDYLASCSEDLWYRDNILATEISTNLSGNGEYSHFSIHTVSNHARKLINYLEEYYNSNFAFVSNNLVETDFKPLDFEQINSNIDAFDKNIKTNTIPDLNPDQTYDASIVNIQNYGFICEIIDTPFFGLLHISEMSDGLIDQYSMGKTLKIKVKKFSKEHNKYQLTLPK
jgi:hypothetical protein